MSIIRSLESFSLPELFKLIERDSKSGRLIIETPISSKTAKRKGIYYIWFKEGQLIAVSDCINQKGLINLIAGRGWLSPLIVSKLRTLCPTSMPLGVYLHRKKLLNKERISLVFQLQLHQVYRLFQLDGGRFRFDDFSQLSNRILTVPWLEMTGQQIKTTEVTMYALRLISNWDNFSNYLPEPSFALQRVVERSHLKLTAVEREIWELANGKTSLIDITILMKQSLSTIQAIAFRLIAVGLVESVFYPSYNWIKPDNQEAQNIQSNYSYRQSSKISRENTSVFDS